MRKGTGDWWSGAAYLAFLPILLLFNLFMIAATLLFSIGRRR